LDPDLNEREKPDPDPREIDADFLLVDHKKIGNNTEGNARVDTSVP
jgi:hypothetical protein